MFLFIYLSGVFFAIYWTYTVRKEVLDPEARQDGLLLFWMIIFCSLSWLASIFNYYGVKSHRAAVERWKDIDIHF